MGSSLRPHRAFFTATLATLVASQACGFSLEASDGAGGDASAGTSSGAPGTSGNTTASSSSGTPASSGEVGSSSGEVGSSSGDMGSSSGDPITDAGPDADRPDAPPTPPCEPIAARPTSCAETDVVCKGDVDLNGSRIRVTDKGHDEKGIVWTRRTISRERAFTWVVTGRLRDSTTGNVGHGLALAFVSANAQLATPPDIAPLAGATLAIAGLPAPYTGAAGYLRIRGDANENGRLALGNTLIPAAQADRVDRFFDVTSPVTFPRNAPPAFRLTATHTAATATATLRLEYRYDDAAAWVLLGATTPITLPAVTQYVGIAGSTGYNTETEQIVTDSVLTCD